MVLRCLDSLQLTYALLVLINNIFDEFEVIFKFTCFYEIAVETFEGLYNGGKVSLGFLGLAHVHEDYDSMAYH